MLHGRRQSSERESEEDADSSSAVYYPQTTSPQTPFVCTLTGLASRAMIDLRGDKGWQC